MIIVWSHDNDLVERVGKGWYVGLEAEELLLTLS